MRTRARFSVLLFLPLLLLAACRSAYQPRSVAFKDYRVTSALPADSSLLQLTAPYRDSVNRSMNEVVGHVERNLRKAQPEGSLNNFMADAMLYAGRQQLHPQADAAFVNYGGIRLTELPAGPVTRGHVFELMPFDNLLILQELTGRQFQAFLDLTAERGGWPVAGITMQIRDKKAVNVRVGGQPLDPDRTYRIINSDYVANGGDNANMLKVLPQKNTGYLMRDAIFDYIKALQAQNRTIFATEENRVTHAQ